MKRFKYLTIASAVAAAFAVPAALAQQPGTTPDSSNRVQQRDATGHPSASPTQPPRSMPGDRSTNDPNMRSGTDRMGSSPHGQYDARTVRDVQQALQDKGYDVGSVDGVMGPRTQSALREFQQQQGITSSGRLDQQTLGALNVSSAGASDRSGAMGSSSSSGTMRDRPASTGNPGSGTIGTSPSGTGAPPTSGTMGSGGTASGSTGSAARGPAGTGNPGSGTIGTSPSGTATPPSSSTSSGRTGG